METWKLWVAQQWCVVYFVITSSQHFTMIQKFIHNCWLPTRQPFDSPRPPPFVSNLSVIGIQSGTGLYFTANSALVYLWSSVDVISQSRRSGKCGRRWCLVMGRKGLMVSILSIIEKNTLKFKMVIICS